MDVRLGLTGTPGHGTRSSITLKVTTRSVSPESVRTSTSSTTSSSTTALLKSLLRISPPPERFLQTRALKAKSRSKKSTYGPRVS